MSWSSSMLTTHGDKALEHAVCPAAVPALQRLHDLLLQVYVDLNTPHTQGANLQLTLNNKEPVGRIQ